LTDMVRHPPHYKTRCVECLEATRGMGFALGNCVKYVYRAPFKNNTQQDLEKARFYLTDHRNFRQSHMLQPSSRATDACRRLAADTKGEERKFFYAIADGDYGFAMDALEALINEADVG